MKVAASDYDGTLFRQDRIAKSDAEAIKKWREAGHKFGVVSGRDHGMLVPQLHHHALCGQSSAIDKAVGMLQPLQLRICMDIAAVFVVHHGKILSSLSH